MSGNVAPKIVRDSSLVLYLDAANTKSYSTGSLFKDLSKNLYNSTITGNPTYSNTHGGSFLFDNIDDLITVNGLDLDTLGSTQNFTVMFGAKKTQYGTSGLNTGNSNLFIGSDNGYNNGWRIVESNLGTPGTTFSGAMSWSFGSPQISSNVTITDSYNRFSICAFSQNGSNVLSFLNGKISSTNTFGAYVSGVSSGKISSGGNGVGRFSGYFSFILIYNRSLSSTEILQNYNALKSRFGL